MIIIKDKFKVLPVSLLLLCTTVISAHPGSGIVVDSVGQVYFTDTGKGVWKLGTQGELTFLPASKFHWMTIDTQGSFATTQKTFGSYFERVTPTGAKPALSSVPIFRWQQGRMEISIMPIHGMLLQRSSKEHLPAKKRCWLRLRTMNTSVVLRQVQTASFISPKPATRRQVRFARLTQTETNASWPGMR